MLPQFVFDLNATDAYIKNNISVSAQVCNNFLAENVNVTSANLTEFSGASVVSGGEFPFPAEIVVMKCCTSKYREFLMNSTENDDWLDTILDVFKGTVS